MNRVETEQDKKIKEKVLQIRWKMFEGTKNFYLV